MTKRSKKTKRIKKNSKKLKNQKILEQKNGKDLIIKTKAEWINKSLVKKSEYENKYKKSLKNNEEFWKKEGKRITWIKPYKKIKNVKYSKDEVRIKWYEDGTLNASVNCIDRHLKDKKDKTAIIWVGDNPKDTKKISY